MARVSFLTNAALEFASRGWVWASAEGVDITSLLVDVSCSGGLSLASGRGAGGGGRVDGLAFRTDT